MATTTDWRPRWRSQSGADQLVLLSDVDGFYATDPAINPQAQRFDVIEKITPEIEAMAGDTASGLSKGGMKTKLDGGQDGNRGRMRDGNCQG